MKIGEITELLDEEEKKIAKEKGKDHQQESQSSSDDSAWKYISAGDISGLADYTNREYNYRNIPYVGQIVGNAASSMMDIYGDTLTGVANQVGMADNDTVKWLSGKAHEYASEGRQYLPQQRTLESYDNNMGEYLADPAGAAMNVGNLLGSMASFAPVGGAAGSLAKGLLGSVGIGARAVPYIDKLAKTSVGAKVLPKVLPAVDKAGNAIAPGVRGYSAAAGRAIQNDLATALGWGIGSGAAEAAAEAGSTYDELVAKGAKPIEAQQKAKDVFWQNLTLLAGTNTVEGFALGRILGLNKALEAPTLKAFMGNTALEGVMNAYEEGAQEGFQMGAKGQQYTLNPYEMMTNPTYAQQKEMAVEGGLGSVLASPLMMAGGKAGKYVNNKLDDYVYGNNTDVTKIIEQMKQEANEDETGRQAVEPAYLGDNAQDYANYASILNDTDITKEQRVVLESMLTTDANGQVAFIDTPENRAKLNEMAMAEDNAILKDNDQRIALANEAAQYFRDEKNMDAFNNAMTVIQSGNNIGINKLAMAALQTRRKINGASNSTISVVQPSADNQQNQQTQAQQPQGNKIQAKAVPLGWVNKDTTVPGMPANTSKKLNLNSSNAINYNQSAAPTQDIMDAAVEHTNNLMKQGNIEDAEKLIKAIKDKDFDTINSLLPNPIKGAVNTVNNINTADENGQPIKQIPQQGSPYNNPNRNNENVIYQPEKQQDPEQQEMDAYRAANNQRKFREQVENRDAIPQLNAGQGVIYGNEKPAPAKPSAEQQEQEAYGKALAKRKVREDAEQAQKNAVPALGVGQGNVIAMGDTKIDTRTKEQRAYDKAPTGRSYGLSTDWKPQSKREFAQKIVDEVMPSGKDIGGRRKLGSRVVDATEKLGIEVEEDDKKHALNGASQKIREIQQKIKEEILDGNREENQSQNGKDTENQDRGNTASESSKADAEQGETAENETAEGKVSNNYIRPEDRQKDIEKNRTIWDDDENEILRHSPEKFKEEFGYDAEDDAEEFLTEAIEELELSLNAANELITDIENSRANGEIISEDDEGELNNAYIERANFTENLAYVKSLLADLSQTKKNSEDVKGESAQEVQEEQEPTGEVVGKEVTQTVAEVKEKEQTAKETAEDQNGKEVVTQDDDGTVRYNIRTEDDAAKKYRREVMDRIIAGLKESDGKVKLTNEDADEIERNVNEAMDIIIKVRNEFGGENGEFGKWLNAQAERLNEELGKAIPKMDAFIKNGEYVLNIDMGTLCVKREPMDAAIQILIDKGHANQLGPIQIQQILDILKKYNYMVPCDICFVESKRVRMLDSANSVSMQWRAVVEGLGIVDNKNVGVDRKLTDRQREILHEMADYRGNTDMDKAKRKEAFKKYIPEKYQREYKGKDNTAIDNGLTPEKMSWIASLMLNNEKLVGQLPIERMMTTKGVDGLVNEFYGSGLEGFLAGNEGSATAKPLHGFRVYDPFTWRNNFDNKSDIVAAIQDVFSIGGIRFQSFSDFNVMQIFDAIQLMTDLAARRLPMHVYTKVPAFVEFFGRTNAMINMSLIAKISNDYDAKTGFKAPAGMMFVRDPKTKAIVRDENGKPKLTFCWADESFPPDKAFEFRKRKEYKGHVGTIAVALSEEHCRALMASHEIDMVIPYHASGLPLTVKDKTGLSPENGVRDFTDVQTTKGKPKKASGFSYNDALRNVGEWEGKNPKKSPAVAAQLYIDWCTEHGYGPEFCEFADLVDEKGNKVDLTKISEETGAVSIDTQKAKSYQGKKLTVTNKYYYKLLEDFRGYDSEGKPVAQEPITTKYIAKDLEKNLKKYLPERLHAVKAISEMHKATRKDEVSKKVFQLVDEMEDMLDRQQRVNDFVLERMRVSLGNALGKGRAHFLSNDKFFDALEMVEKKERVTVLRQSNAIVYGFAKGTDIYINSSVINADTPAHEFSHIWYEVYKNKFSKAEWFGTNSKKGMLDEIIDVILDDEEGKRFWDEVAADKHYENIWGNKDEMLNEVLARIVGAKNNQLVGEILGNSYVKRPTTVGKSFGNRLKQLLKDMFNHICDVFGLERVATYEEFTEAPIRAIWDEKSGKAFNKHLQEYRNNKKKEQTKAEREAKKNGIEYEAPEDDWRYSQPKEREVLLAPNGKPSNLTPKQYHQVRTPAFKKWFGDWENDHENVSKVVDENGEPLVVDGVFLNLDSNKAIRNSLRRIEQANKCAEKLKAEEKRIGIKYNPENTYELERFAFAANDDVIAFFDGRQDLFHLVNAIMAGETPKLRVAFRYGRINTETMTSRNFADDYVEKGVSVVGRVADMNTEKNSYYDMFFGRKHDYYITLGVDVNNKGSDGEMLLSPAYTIGKAENQSTIIKSATDNIGTFDSENPDIRYSLAGEKSNTADRLKLDEAQRMQEAGESKKSIWDKTGWVKGKDNKWRYEIPDNLNKFNMRRFNSSLNLHLKDVYNNPQLYKAYPWAKDIIVTNADFGDEDTNGQMVDGEILVNYKDNNDVKKLTILHELQHAIQDYEGFAYGTSPEYIQQADAAKTEEQANEEYRRHGGEQESREVESRAATAKYSELYAKASKELRRAADTYLEWWNDLEASEDDERGNALDGFGIAGRNLKQLINAADGEFVTDEDGELRNPYRTKINDMDLETGEVFDSKPPVMPTIHTADAIIKFSGEEIPLKSQAPSVRYSIASKLSNLFSGKQKDTAINRKILQQHLEALTGYKIKWGKLTGKENAIIRDVDKLIRAKRDYDFQSVIPLMGKNICNGLGINSTDEMNNYIADWIITGAVNNTSQEAKDFAAAMKKKPDFADKLMDVRSSFEQYNNLRGLEYGKTIISFNNEEKSTFKDFIHKVYDQWVEELGPVKRMVEEVERNSKGKLKFNALTNPYTAFRLYRGNPGKAMALIEGKGKIVEALKVTFPNVDFTNFKTLRQILESVGAVGNTEKMKNFSAYCLACHVNDIHKKNAAALAADPKAETMPTPMSEAKVRECLTQENEKKYGQAQKDLVRFSNTILQILHQGGMVSQKNYHKMKNAWPNYIPMFRVFDEDETKTFGDSTLHVTGSEKTVVNPLESIIKNTFEFIARAEKNQAKLKLAGIARCGGFGQIIEEVSEQGKVGETIPFHENGKVKYLETDPDIAKCIQNMGRDSTNMCIQLLRVPASIARAAFTVKNLSFAARNVFRDTADAMIYAKYGYNPTKDLVGGFFHALNRDEIFYEWLASGAAMSGRLTLDRNYTQESLSNLTKTWKQKSGWEGMMDFINLVNDYSEQMTRIGVYERTKKGMLEDGASPAEAIAEAALDSRDLMDFARGGKAGRFMNQVVIFANASIQGWDKFFRTFDASDKKKFGRAVGKLFFVGMLPALILALFNHDKDWWREAPEWQKQNHWMLAVGDTIIRIPKGADVGIRFFSNVIENIIDNISYGKNIKANNLLKPLLDNLPDWQLTALTPIQEAVMNYSYFAERPIVPRKEERLPAKMQYGETTTTLAKYLGEKLDIAPRKIDHVLYGYTGNLGRGIVDTAETVAGKRKAFDFIKEEAPIASGLLTIPYKSPQTVEDYYKELDKQSKYKAEWQQTKVKPAGFNPQLLKRLEAAKKPVKRLADMERKIINDSNLTRAQKKDKQIAIQKQRIEIMRKALNR